MSDIIADTMRAMDPDHGISHPLANQEAKDAAEIRKLKRQLAEVTEVRDSLRQQVDRLTIKLSRMCGDA